jgi:hypothetical protein
MPSDEPHDDFKDALARIKTDAPAEQNADRAADEAVAALQRRLCELGAFERATVKLMAGETNGEITSECNLVWRMIGNTWQIGVELRNLRAGQWRTQVYSWALASAGTRRIIGMDHVSIIFLPSLAKAVADALAAKAAAARDCQALADAMRDAIDRAE